VLLFKRQIRLGPTKKPRDHKGHEAALPPPGASSGARVIGTLAVRVDGRNPAGMHKNVERDFAHRSIAVNGEVKEVVLRRVVADLLRAREVPLERAADLARPEPLGDPFGSDVEPRDLNPRVG